MRFAPAAATAILLGLLLGSCGGDDDPTSPPPVRPPTPVVIELPPSPVFGSFASVAQAAEDTVSALLARIDTPTVMHTTLAAVPSLTWVAEGACWTGPGASGGLEYGACPTVPGWSWEILAAGDTLLAEGETDATGRRGEFRAFDAPGDVSVAWTWIATTSRDSVAWTYARANENVALHWSRDDAGARLWLWTWPDDHLVGYRISSSRTTGWCETYDRSPDRWILRREFAWDGGHGHWLEFDAAGQETDRTIW